MPDNKENIAASDLRGRLYYRYYGPLKYYFAKRIKDRSDTEDLAQETLLRILRSPSVTRLEHADAYVFTVASNLLKVYRRKAQRFKWEIRIPIEDAAASELEFKLVEDLTPERFLLDRDSLKETMATLEELGERTCNIFLLFRLEHTKQKDIAAIFGISQSTVEKHVKRAMLYLATRHGVKSERAS